jgi:hypothetical protein
LICSSELYFASWDNWPSIVQYLGVHPISTRYNLAPPGHFSTNKARMDIIFGGLDALLGRLFAPILQFVPFPVLYLVTILLCHLRIEVIVLCLQQVLELCLLVFEQVTARWIRLHERQQHRDQQPRQVGVPSVKKLILIVFLNLCLFLLLLLEII